MQLKNTEVGLSGSQEFVSHRLESGHDPHLCKQKMKSSLEALLEEFSEYNRKTINQSFSA